jgi:hypothetical protein
MQDTGELAIGCERCHGPGSKHVEAAKQKAVAGSKLDPEHDRTWIVHGLKDLSLDQQNQICGQCHARVGNRDQRDLAFQNHLFVKGRARRPWVLTRRQQSHRTWPGIGYLLAGRKGQEESHTVAGSSKRRARHEGWCELLDVSRLPRGCGVEGPTAGKQAAAAH